jgi:hypothetical protein
MLNIAAAVSLFFAAICFFLFVYQVLVRRVRLTSPADPNRQEGDRADQVRPFGTAADLAKLIEAFAKLAESLEKTGPLAMSMFGAMFFMVLAAGFGK